MIDLTKPEIRREFKKSHGIYVFKNSINNKHYVGSAKFMGKRIMDHLSCLQRSRHQNKHLQAAWNKYGKEKFLIFCLEQVDDEQLLREREQHWIDTLDSYKNGYNRSPIAERPQGFTFSHTEEFKEKMSKLRKGIKFSEEHKKNLSIARKSYSQPREVIEKARTANTGRKRSEESISKMRESRNRVKDKASETVRKNAGRSASGYKGVYGKRDMWQSKLKFSDGKEKSLGCFSSVEEAAKNYDYHSVQEYGIGNCYLNFPNEDYTKFTPLKSRNDLFVKESTNELKKDTAPNWVIYNPKS